MEVPSFLSNAWITASELQSYILHLQLVKFLQTKLRFFVARRDSKKAEKVSKILNNEINDKQTYV